MNKNFELTKKHFIILFERPLPDSLLLLPLFLTVSLSLTASQA
jgi:hypothetical protein